MTYKSFIHNFTFFNAVSKDVHGHTLQKLKTISPRTVTGQKFLDKYNGTATHDILV